MYEPQANHIHKADEKLNQKLINKLSKKHKVWNGPTVTCQAMMAETWDDIKKWSSEGYFSVEMEAVTVFAVSNYFKVSSSALLGIGDNLVQEKPVLDVNYEAGSDTRQNVRRHMLRTVIQEIIINPKSKINNE